VSDNKVKIIITAKNLATAALKRTASLVTKTVGGAVKGLAKQLTSLKTIAIAAFAGWGLKNLGESFLDVGMSTERYKTILETVLKSAEKAKEYFAWIADFAAKTPFEIPGLMEAATRLESYQLSAKKYLGTLGDTAASMGKPIMAAVEMIADASQGEFERLKEFGFRATDVAKRAGFESVQVMNSTRENLTKATETLMTMLNERYAGGMEKLSRTLEGMLSTLRDYWGQFQQMVMDSGVFDFIKSKVALVLETLERLKSEGKMKEWAEEIGTMVVDAFEKGWSAVKKLAEKIRELYESGQLKAWAEEAVNVLGTLWDVLKRVTEVIEKISNAAKSVSNDFKYGYTNYISETGQQYQLMDIAKFTNDLAIPIDPDRYEVEYYFTGSGSSKLPLSEKIAELQNKFTNFSNYVSNMSTDYGIDASGATQALSSALESVNTDYESKLSGMVNYIAERQAELEEVSSGQKFSMYNTYRNIIKGQIEAAKGQIEDLVRTWETEQNLTEKYYGGNTTTNLGGITINASGGNQDWRDIVRNQIIPELRTAGVI